MDQSRLGVPHRFCPGFGTELFFRSWIPSHPRSILVLIHGAGQHSGNFHRFGRYCRARRITAYALDLRGFGQSTGTRGHILTFHQYLEDLHQFIHLVQRTHPGHPIFLLGHSFGGTVVVRYAQEYPTRIHGIILSVPALQVRMPIPSVAYHALSYLSRTMPALSMDLTRWHALFSGMGQRPSGWERVRRYKPPDPWATHQFSVRWLTELLQNGQDALTRAASFRWPVLTFCGQSDSLIDPRAVQSFNDALAVSDKHHLVFHSMPHDWILDAQPGDALYRYLVGWMVARISSVGHGGDLSGSKESLRVPQSLRLKGTPP